MLVGQLVLILAIRWISKYDLQGFRRGTLCLPEEKLWQAAVGWSSG